MTLNITPEQEQIIIDALRDRIGKLYDMSEQYKGTGFTDCQKDCVATATGLRKAARRVTGPLSSTGAGAMTTTTWSIRGLEPDRSFPLQKP